ncbi:MAG TPA: di-heme oxidoredictase family protein [Terriglobia bacterium]|nr:di-heme oxidoredictase family protein [Terriglobia bacterium]
MKRLFSVVLLLSLLFFLILAASHVFAQSDGDSFGHPEIGREVSIPVHLQDGQEYDLPILQLVAFGEKLFTARWTSQEGAGRPLTKGTGAPLSDASDPLVFPRNTNRLSGPDANSCSGCHNLPYVGGGGDIVTKVFVEGNRFDFLTFDHNDTMPIKGAVDERGEFVTQQSAADPRKTIGMNGSGFIEMLARQMTAELQRIRDATPIGGARLLDTKGVSFGVIARRADGSWDTSHVVGLPPQSLASSGPDNPPSLLILPFAQSGNVVSLRVFTNSAFNQHIGIQSEERFGVGVDADGDGFINELTRADVTAVTLFQATLPVPGRVINTDPYVEAAIVNGEKQFRKIGCSTCHIPALRLDNEGWVYTEPNPYNPVGNLRPGDAPAISIDLTSSELPGPHLKPINGVVYVPAYTDLKLHNICDGPNDPNTEPLNQNQPAGGSAFFAGNQQFITRKLWGLYNSGPFMHHGQFTTMREAILAHHGEAEVSSRAFRALSKYDQGSIIEFLKSLQVLPPGAHSLCIDQNGRDIACLPTSEP